ncbi:Rv3654c family TadE-like protein [Cellulomonas fimi]|uniref:Rv3654c family TadE-like protein n=1 Tax=Cellulomonas fimi TaxID=1708 RepID=UPI0022B2A8E3|nr:Rv3654c family TadE-like protein [Cellulomonas fimi]
MSEDRERGSGTVAVLGVVAVALVLAATLGVVAGGQARHVEAQAAADLAALAAATAWRSGVADPCGTAARVVARNHARLVSCTLGTGGVARVSTARDTALGALVAGARAGPASARDAPRRPARRRSPTAEPGRSARSARSARPTQSARRSGSSRST